VPRRALAALGLLLALPAQASAHGGTGMPSATATRVVVTGIAPAVPGLAAEVVGNDFQVRLRLPRDAQVTVDRIGGARPLRARGGTLTWRDDRLRHPRPDGSVQIGFTVDGTPVVVGFASRKGDDPAPWVPLLLALVAAGAGARWPRASSALAVSAFATMLIGAAGGLLVGRGVGAAIAACVVVLVLSLLAAQALAAVPERFRQLAAGGLAGTSLLLAMAQVPMLYRAFPVSVLPDRAAWLLEAVALALAVGALTAVAVARPWRAIAWD
jgi:hypothetical protein